MNQLHQYLNDIFDFAHQGFAGVNGVLGLIIAVVAIFTMSSYRAILVTTLGSTVVYLIAERLAPVISNHAPLTLPDIMVMAFWRHVGLVAVGLLIAITVLYVIKRLVLRGGH